MLRNTSEYMPLTIKDSVVWLLRAQVLGGDVELLQWGAFISLLTVAEFAFGLAATGE